MTTPHPTTDAARDAGQKLHVVEDTRARNSHEELLTAARKALHYMRLHQYADAAWADDLDAAISRATGGAQ